MNYLEDIFLFIGILFILIPTFLLNVFIGCYLLGILFIIIGFILMKTPERRE